MKELWKPIPGYEGIYDASSWGRIRSSPGKTTANARYSTRVWKSRIMKEKHPTSSKRKDRRVSLWKDGIHQDYLVSRLVASAWIGVPEKGMTVNHINGDYTDNRPENLEWVPLGENIRDGFETGLYGSFCCKTVLQGEDGIKMEFRSKSEASRYLGRCNGYISLLISKGKYLATDVSGRMFRIFTEQGREGA